MLTVIDEYAREALSVTVKAKIGAADVLEVLYAEWFTSLHQAQTVINIWLKQYNHIRPHQALGMRPPVPETLLEKAKISGT
jgi:transposase InsO family protein